MVRTGTSWWLPCIGDDPRPLEKWASQSGQTADCAAVPYPALVYAESSRLSVVDLTL